MTQTGTNNAIIFLKEIGLSDVISNKIINLYKDQTITIISENPYRLASDIFGIGFNTTDKIAEKLEIDKNSANRAEAGCQYVLNQLLNNGHVYYPYDLLINQCKKILDISADNIISAISKAELERKIIIEDIDNEKAVYLSPLFNAENEISKEIKRLLLKTKNKITHDESFTLKWVQQQLDIEFATNQAEAVIEALRHNVMVITGGPGTGKTTIIQAIIKIFLNSGSNVSIAAPTGRAAKRITEATGYEAKTIHRLLEFSYESRGTTPIGAELGFRGASCDFKRNSNNPLTADVIIIDEAGMVDTILMAQLLKAVNGVLILVGDVNQLPSVGPGNVLKDIIESGRVNTVRLDVIFRQSAHSLIIQNAHSINKGDLPTLTFNIREPQDFYFFEIEEQERIVQKIILLCKDKIPQRFGYHPITDIAVLTPMKKGVLGVNNLNMELQKALNPGDEDFLLGQKTFKRGDKVMQTVNNYNEDIYNGDIGRIINIKGIGASQEITVGFDNGLITYNSKDIDQLTLAYALSIHKSQGSEFPVVLIPVHTSHYIMLARNLLYTAVTRGKRLVILIGTKKAINIAIKNNNSMKRYSRLNRRLMLE